MMSFRKKADSLCIRVGHNFLIKLCIVRPSTGWFGCNKGWELASVRRRIDRIRCMR